MVKKQRTLMISLAKRRKIDDSWGDLISQLPDHILVSIINLLTMKEALETSILSRRWRYLWTYFPRLDFDAQDILDEFKTCYRIKDRNIYEKLNTKRAWYVNWVNHVLGSYDGSCIEVLRIRFDLDLKWESEIDKWVQFAMKKKVNMFELNLSFNDMVLRDEPYSFLKQPYIGFSWCTSLTILKLMVDVDGEVLEYFLCNCQCLEMLYVCLSPSLVHLSVKGSSLKLKHLELCKCEQLNTLQISAPKLVSFHYCGPIISMKLENTHKLVEILFDGEYATHVQFNMFKLSNYSSQLQKLTLNVDAYDGFEGNNEHIECPHFENLKELELITWAGGDDTLLPFISIVKKAPLLQKFCLELTYLDYEKRPLMEIEKWGLEHMKVVEIIGFVGRPIDTELALFFTSNSLALEKLILDTRKRSGTGKMYFADSKKKIRPRRRRAMRFQALLPPRVELVIF